MVVRDKVEVMVVRDKVEVMVLRGSGVKGCGKVCHNPEKRYRIL